LAPKSLRTIGQKDLEEALGNIAKAVFGPDVKYRLNKDTFPYTDPSLEMEVDIGGKWVEVVGCGVVKGSVLEKLGVDYEGVSVVPGQKTALFSLDYESDLSTRVVGLEFNACSTLSS